MYKHTHTQTHTHYQDYRIATYKVAILKDRTKLQSTQSRVSHVLGS